MKEGEADANPAFAAALRLLTRRDHSEQELCRKLCQKGYSTEAVAEVVGRLKKLNYLDDRRFAVAWVEMAVSAKRFFGPRLRMELSRRGIPRELAEEVVDSVIGGRSEFDLVAELLQRKFPRFEPAGAAQAEVRRIYNYMLRKGFSSSVIIRVLRQSETC